MFGLAISGSVPLPRFDVDDEVPVSCLCSDSGIIFSSLGRLCCWYSLVGISNRDFKQGVQGAGVLWVAFDPEDVVFFEVYDMMLLSKGGTGRAECVSYKRPKTKEKKRAVVCVCDVFVG